MRCYLEHSHVSTEEARASGELTNTACIPRLVRTTHLAVRQSGQRDANLIPDWSSYFYQLVCQLEIIDLINIPEWF